MGGETALCPDQAARRTLREAANEKAPVNRRFF
jgi:hypothetical protein